MFRFNLIEKLKLVVHIGKTKEQERDLQRVGALDEGIDTTFINCEGVGPDGGLISRGKGLRSINSRWVATGEGDQDK